MAASGVCAYALLPWQWFIRGVWLVGGIFLVWVAYLFAQVARDFYRLRCPPPPLPPVTPMPCPACGHTEHDYQKQGLWDGYDKLTGRGVGGSYGYGVCKRCGCRWGQWDDAAPYVASSDEWEREITRPQAARAEQLRRWGTENGTSLIFLAAPAAGR